MGDVVAKANDYLQGMVRSLRGTTPDVHCAVRQGPAAKAITDYAGEKGIEQIVMATHGYGGLKRLTHGSVAEHVLQTANVPVLMVRGRNLDPADARKPIACRRVLVPLDGSKRAEQILSPVSRIAKPLGCEMILFQVVPTFLFEASSRAAERMVKGYLGEVADRLTGQGIKASVATGTGMVAESIVQFAATNQVDLIAMSTRGRTGITRWALGSAADQVLHMGCTPVLLTRATVQPSPN
jgi:nucleotide-binding universal stress UspA family protein